MPTLFLFFLKYKQKSEISKFTENWHLGIALLEVIRRTVIKDFTEIKPVCFGFVILISSVNIFETWTSIVYSDWSDEVQMNLFNLLEVKLNNFL